MSATALDPPMHRLCYWIRNAFLKTDRCNARAVVVVNMDELKKRYFGVPQLLVDAPRRDVWGTPASVLGPSPIQGLSSGSLVPGKEVLVSAVRMSAAITRSTSVRMNERG